MNKQLCALKDQFAEFRKLSVYILIQGRTSLAINEGGNFQRLCPHPKSQRKQPIRAARRPTLPSGAMYDFIGAFVKFRPCQKEKDGCITIVENIGYKVALMIRKRLGQKPLFSRLTSRFIHSHTGVNKENRTGGGGGGHTESFYQATTIVIGLK